MKGADPLFARRLLPGLAVRGAAVLFVAAVLGLTMLPARADPPLAGEFLVADTHGQAFCTTPEALRQYLIATIRRDATTTNSFPKLCTIAPYGTRVQVLQDLSPVGTRLHMVRARATTPLQTVDGYTYSVGLYDARRFQPYSPFGEYFPRVP